MIEYRYSERGRIRAGEVFRARGGPTYKGQRVGSPGYYRLIGVEEYRCGTYLVAARVDRYGVQAGGTVTLYVSGDSYELEELPGWLVRPYRVARKRLKFRKANREKARCKR